MFSKIKSLKLSKLSNFKNENVGTRMFESVQFTMPRFVKIIYLKLLEGFLDV